MIQARPSKPRFSGGFKTFTVSKSINRETRVESRLIVFSQGSRSKVLEYLWLKHLWDELTKKEYELLILSGILKSELKYDTLRVINIQGKKKTRDKIQEFFPDGEFSRVRYQGFKRLDVEIYEYQRSLPKTPKFSGWIRSASAKGSKRSPGATSYLEALTHIDHRSDRISLNWYELLTVDDS